MNGVIPESFYEKKELQPYLSDSSKSCHNLTCPPWAYYDTSCVECKCYGNNYVLNCSLLEGQTSVLNYHCLTYDSTRNVTVLGDCLYLLNDNHMFYYKVTTRNVLELNKATCGLYHRTGTLCGNCEDGKYLQAYSYNMTCIACAGGWSNIIKYLAVAYGPLTIFYVIIILFKVNVHSSWLQGYVFLCQYIASPVVLRKGFAVFRENRDVYVVAFKLAQVLMTVAGIWNFDFFRLYNFNICFTLRPLEVLSLDFLIALYPLLLIILTYILIASYDQNNKILITIWRPFNIIVKILHRNWDVQTYTIDVFATFMILSNIKLLNVCFDILRPVKVYTVSKDGGYMWAVFYDATIPYFGHEHCPYAILAILVLVIFILIPMFLMLLYPLKACQKVFNFFPHRWQIVLNTLVDSFQGCYRNGTEPGTRDCRWFSAMPFIVRVVIFGLYINSVNQYSPNIFVLMIILTIVIDPYKPCQKKNLTNFVIFHVLLTSLLSVFLLFDFVTNIVTVYAIGLTTGLLCNTYAVIVVLYEIIHKWKYYVNHWR